MKLKVLALKGGPIRTPSALPDCSFTHKKGTSQRFVNSYRDPKLSKLNFGSKKTIEGTKHQSKMFMGLSWHFLGILFLCLSVPQKDTPIDKFSPPTQSWDNPLICLRFTYVHKSTYIHAQRPARARLFRFLEKRYFGNR